MNEQQPVQAAFRAGEFRNKYVIARAQFDVPEDKKSKEDPLAILGVFKSLGMAMFGLRDAALPYRIEELWRILIEVQTSHGTLLLKIPFYDDTILALKRSCQLQ